MKSEPKNRVHLLETAIQLTTGERNKNYGDPVDNMRHIADIASAILQKHLTARDIAVVHQATKLARSRTSSLLADNYIDHMAYTGIEYECAVAELDEDLDEGDGL